VGTCPTAASRHISPKHLSVGSDVALRLRDGDATGADERVQSVLALVLIAAVMYG
jgi:hypothetical protein